MRYLSQLSQLNFSIDHNFYPLGSCTMKYNPKIDDEIAGMPGFAEIHPLQPDATVQGALRLMWELQQRLVEITGMAGCSLAPMAGADGEFAGILMARAYHMQRGDTARTRRCSYQTARTARTPQPPACAASRSLPSPQTPTATPT